MRLNSITFKLLAIIIAAFSVMTLGVLVLADRQLHQIVDRSQEAVYIERVDTIIGILSRNNERLNKTGLVEAYIDDFKQSTLTALRQNYYGRSGEPIYPFIIATDGTIILHPELPAGDTSLKNTSIATQMLSSMADAFIDVYQGQEKWYMYRHFGPWNWVIAYAVPLDIKYGDARRLRNTLIIILSATLAFVLPALLFIVTRFTKPIVELTNASRQIAGGDFGHRFDLNRKDELGKLAHNFEKMRTAIRNQIAELNHEIIERKRVEKDLRESEARLSEAQKMAGLGYWEWTIETGHVSWSEEVYNMYHQDPSRFTPRIDTIMKFSPWPETVNTHQEIVQIAKKNKQVGRFDQKFLRPDGSIGYYHSTFRGKYNDDGQLVSIGGTVFDITERKKQESELRQLRNYLSNIINSMPSMLMGVDGEGVITQWNLEAQRVTGLSELEVLNRPLANVVPQLSIEIERVRQAIEDQQKLTDAKRSRREGDKIIYEDITIYPLITNGVEGAVIRVDDVTERVRMEEMMIQSEKMLSVGGLAAGMAHEINNPLAGMMQTAEVMASRLGAKLQIPANQRAAEAAGTSMVAIENFMTARGIPRMIDTINAAGKRVAAIVDNMLSFARKDDVTVSSHHLDQILDKTLVLAATDYDLKKKYDFKLIEVTKHYADDLPSVPCQSAKIQQVLLNIIRNGAHAMQEAGTHPPRFIFRTWWDKERQQTCVSIEDNGPGMDATTCKRVFEPFFTTKAVGYGTGLGLSVSYFIVTEDHGGQMTVESRPGSGARFIVCLPLEGK